MIGHRPPKYGRSNCWLLVPALGGDRKTLLLGHPELRWVSRPGGVAPASGSVNLTEKRALCKTPSGSGGKRLRHGCFSPARYYKIFYGIS